MHYERFYLQTALYRCPHPASSSGELGAVLLGVSPGPLTDVQTHPHLDVHYYGQVGATNNGKWYYDLYYTLCTRCTFVSGVF